MNQIYVYRVENGFIVCETTPGMHGYNGRQWVCYNEDQLGILVRKLFLNKEENDK